VRISFIETSEENLKTLQKYTQIKTAKYDQYNFITKCTKVNNSDNLIRMAIESTEYFYNNKTNK
jgi:hypothetical protein